MTATEGAVVIKLFSGSPATKAGIQPGDVIVQWGENSVDTCEKLSLLVAETPIGSRVDVLIRRDNVDITVKVDVVLRPRQME